MVWIKWFIWIQGISLVYMKRITPIFNYSSQLLAPLYLLAPLFVVLSTTRTTSITDFNAHFSFTEDWNLPLCFLLNPISGIFEKDYQTSLFIHIMIRKVWKLYSHNQLKCSGVVSVTICVSSLTSLSFHPICIVDFFSSFFLVIPKYTF